MPRRSAYRLRTHQCLLALLAGCFCGSAAAQESIDSSYLKHQSDPVQQIYSRAVLGYALNQKCRQLDATATDDYERRLNQATGIFQGYVAAQNFVPGPSQAVQYTHGMLLGVARFAGSSECDAEANNRVRLGYHTAQNFVPLLRELFGAPSQK